MGFLGSKGWGYMFNSLGFIDLNRRCAFNCWGNHDGSHRRKAWEVGGRKAWPRCEKRCLAVHIGLALSDAEEPGPRSCALQQPTPNLPTSTTTSRRAVRIFVVNKLRLRTLGLHQPQLQLGLHQPHDLQLQLAFHFRRSDRIFHFRRTQGLKTIWSWWSSSAAWLTRQVPWSHAPGAVFKEISVIARRRHIKAIICSMDSMDLDLVFLEKSCGFSASRLLFGGVIKCTICGYTCTEGATR